MKSMAIWLPVVLAQVWCVAPVAAADRTDIAVMKLRADVKLDEGLVRTLNEVLLNQFARHKQLKVLGYSDIAAMLQHEEQKNMLAACTQDSCLAELGGALGVSVLAVPSLGAVGSNYVVNLKLLDVTNSQVIGRASEIVAREDDELLAAFSRAVDQVVDAALPAPKPKPDRLAVDGSGPSGRPVVEKGAAPTTPFLSVAPWVALGLTLAVGVGGGTMAGLALEAERDASGYVEGTSAWASSRDDAQSRALVADVLFGVAGAFAVTTIVLFLVGDDGDEPAATVGFSPADGGGVASCRIRF